MNGSCDAQVSLGEIKELAGVGRPTVSNWRRRHSREVLAAAGDPRVPFPEPVGGSDSKPLFDAREVAEWLDLRPVPEAEPGKDGRLPSYGDEFRRRLRLRGIVALKCRLGSAEVLISQALAVIAMEAEGMDWIPECLPADLVADHAEAAPEVESAVRELIAEIGCPEKAADALLGLGVEHDLAHVLESDLVMDTTPDEVVSLVSALIGPNEGGPDERSVISLCAGLGELLLGMDGGPDDLLGMHGELVAVEPDPLRRKLLRYRLFSRRMAGSTDVCSRPAELDDLRTWDQPAEGPFGFPSADIVLADPPYSSGEREKTEEGPLWWALEAVRRLNPGGRAYVVVPIWTLTRTRGAAVAPSVDARESLLARGCVEAVVQLPRRIHSFRTGAEYALLVLRSPSEEGEALLIDADRIARRTSGRKWIAHVVQLMLDDERPDSQEARWTAVRAGLPGEEQLLDNSSVLPAHRLAAPEPGVDHFDETIAARRVTAAAMPHLREWLGDMGIAKRAAPARHSKLDGYLKAGQLKLLPGHRIAADDIGESGLPVVGREEMLGALPLGKRRVDPTVLARYKSAAVTEKGDVFLLAEHGVRCRVDEAGGCVLLAPVQGLRIAAYSDYQQRRLKGETVRHDGLWMRPQPLAELLQAGRNQLRGSGSLVRRVSVREMDLPQLSPEEITELEAILSETERLRADVKRQLEVLDNLADRISAGVADGELALRRRPGASNPDTER